MTDKQKPRDRWAPYTEEELREQKRRKTNGTPDKIGYQPAKKTQRGQSTKFRIYMISPSGKKVLVPIGTVMDEINGHAIYPYSETVCDQICELVMQGMTIKRIGETDGYPLSSTIYHWIAKHENFREKMDVAKKARAHHYNDRIVEVIEGATEKTSKMSKIQVDGLRHLAAVGDPDEFGNRTKLVGDKNAPISFFVDTGIGPPPSEALPDSIPAEGGEVEDG